MEKTSTFSAGQPSSLETPIRKATVDDLDQILAFSKQFVAASPYRDVGLDEQAVSAVIYNLLNSESGVIFISDGGFLAGALTPLFFRPDITVATEIAWYAPGANGTLFREVFEAWAQSMGAAAVQMNTLNNEHAAGLALNLSNNGYTPVEVSYLKAL